jgi:hypothetical protein
MEISVLSVCRLGERDSALWKCWKFYRASCNPTRVSWSLFQERCNKKFFCFHLVFSTLGFCVSCTPHVGCCVPFSFPNIFPLRIVCLLVWWISEEELKHTHTHTHTHRECTYCDINFWNIFSGGESLSRHENQCS